jgi:hypothetical protein
MPTVDEILASSPLAGLRRVSRGGGDREVALVRLAERFADLDNAPATSLVVLSRAASAEITDYRLDMALRWAAVNRVTAVAAFSAEQWRPTVTAMDIAGRAGIALLSIPADAELAGLVQAIMAEIGGGPQQALARAQQGLDAVLRAEQAGADLDRLRDVVGRALGVGVEFHPRTAGADSALGNGGPVLAGGTAGPRPGGAGPTAPTGVSVPVVVGETVIGELTAPDAHGDLAVAARLVLFNAAAAAGRLLDLSLRAREVPVRSRSAAGRAAHLGLRDRRGPAGPGAAAEYRPRRLARRDPAGSRRPGRSGVRWGRPGPARPGPWRPG